MEKEKVIDLTSYRDRKTAEARAASESIMSEELKNAIQLLIRRLKEEGPLPQPA